MASEQDKILSEVTESDYKYGFVTDIENETIPKGLSEDVVRLISQKKGEPDWLLEFRLKAYRHWLTMGSLAKAALQYPEIVNRHYGRYADVSEESLVALNTAFAQDGIFLYVPKSTVLEKPIQIINILLSDEALLTQPRNLFVLEENSQTKVVVCDHTLSPQNFLTNSATEVFAGKGSNFEYVRMELRPIPDMEADIVKVLKNVYDPEIPVNIYDLGLIYEVNIDDSRKVEVKLTLTAPNCPMADQLIMEVNDRVGEITGVTDVVINLTFDPPWDKSMMSEEAMLDLGFL